MSHLNAERTKTMPDFKTINDVFKKLKEQRDKVVEDITTADGSCDYLYGMFDSYVYALNALEQLMTHLHSIPDPPNGDCIKCNGVGEYFELDVNDFITCPHCKGCGWDQESEVYTKNEEN